MQSAPWRAIAFALSLFASAALAQEAATDAKGGASEKSGTSEGQAATQVASAATAPSAAAVVAAPPAPIVASLLSNWKFEGDFRVRYEGTTKQEPTDRPAVLDSRHRGVVRFRAGATRSIGKNFFAGGRLTTGSAEDPNSPDLTIGEFDDKFELNLDRLFIEMRQNGAVATAGKFANPFTTTELVWDGDVSTQGFATSWTGSSARVKPRLTGLLFLVDEQTITEDSYMAGAQAGVTWKPSTTWSATFAGGYYDYTIESLRNADAGDTRTNRLTADRTAYLSDFNLLDGVVQVDHPGFHPRFPIRFVGNVVKNTGADDQDTGFGADLFLGRVADKGDMRFRYGYSQAQTDAILTAFSHDNTTLASNYKQHTMTFDYQLRKEIQLNATCYVYSQLEGPGQKPTFTRLRFNVLLTF